MRAGLTEIAWEYRWSSAAAYVKQVVDRVTDPNPYLGELTQPACAMYGEALMSNVDEKVVRVFEGCERLVVASLRSHLNWNEVGIESEEDDHLKVCEYLINLLDSN